MSERDFNVSGSEIGKDGNGPYLYRGDSVTSVSSIGSSIFRKGDTWVPSLHNVLENGVKIPLFGCMREMILNNSNINLY